MVGIKWCANNVVTDCYLEVIKKAFQMAGMQVEDFDFGKTKKEDIIVVSTVIEFFQVYFRGYHNIVFWMQGIEPEESYMKHQSIMKQKTLEIMTWFAIRKSKFIFFVSNRMREYVNKKYHLNTNSYSYIMPCFNSTLDEDCFNTANKYKDNVFTYIGSLSQWQCFSETLDFFRLIKNIIIDAKLIIYTSEIDKANHIICEKGLQNVTVNYVNSSEMNAALSKVKFGFILRENNPVNNVATPTKMSSYLAAGVIPVYSGCIDAFREVLEKTEFSVCVESINSVPTKLIDLCNRDICSNQVLNEYRLIFDNFYSIEKHIASISNILMVLFREF